MNKQEIELLSKEVEMLMVERTSLLKVVGAAAKLINSIDAKSLPPEAMNSAELISEMLNALPEEALKDALDAIRTVSQ
jgi:hypothetical protein